MKKLILILALLGSNAHAQFFSGNDLLERLRNPRGIHDSSISMGYVAGVHDAMDTILFCTNQNVTLGQIRDVVMQWLVNNPQHRDKAANVVVVSAIKDTWPCARGGKL